jgi:hypothetical protein
MNEPQKAGIVLYTSVSIMEVRGQFILCTLGAYRSQRMDAVTANAPYRKVAISTGACIPVEGASDPLCLVPILCILKYGNNTGNIPTTGIKLSAINKCDFLISAVPAIGDQFMKR